MAVAFSHSLYFLVIHIFFVVLHFTIFKLRLFVLVLYDELYTIQLR